jgi:pimeloyl-ACP methyl ester carboxylesterase
VEKEVHMPDSTSQKIILKDGRTLGYAEYGVPNGKPVFYFHGIPSSRLDGWRLHEPAKQTNAYIIAIDRPGIGLSDFKAGRRYLDWPDDVSELADNLRIDRFAVLGASAGGSYAMACASKIPQRLTAVALVSSPCPFNVPTVTKDLSRFQRLSVFVVRRALWFARVRMSMLARKVYRDPVGIISRVNGEIADIDKAVLDKSIINSPEGLNRAVATLQQAFHMGARGVTWEYSLLMNSWGFLPEDISIKIKLWHGEADKTVPVSMGRYLATTLPNCQANFLPGEGHYMVINHARDILSDLIV